MAGQQDPVDEEILETTAAMLTEEKHHGKEDFSNPGRLNDDK